ncbi:PD-(D/E)XK nuclease family protein [Niallia sp. XMNu-256]|uniref:PD-(D/E)XK nuclease family protein n=1 Tax=Niallia sp. XMNu-256 TaxID=3082444 RepID=UPI0030CE5A60
MTSSHPVISVKTMTDYHLESFLRCPYKFYYQHILSINSNQVKWRQAVQLIINQVVQRFYQLPPNAQHKLNLLKLIDRSWKNVSLQLFESKVDYYMILAKTTDHLLQFLSPRQEQKPPLFLKQKLNTYIEELETQLSLTFELAEWSTHSFTVKKFLVEADEEMIQLYNHLMVVFSSEAFGKLPDRIEIITLLEGEKYTFSPTMNNVTQGIMYLKDMKNLLQHPNDYSKTNSLTECRSCSFTHKCKGGQNNFIENTRPNNEFLH